MKKHISAALCALSLIGAGGAAAQIPEDAVTDIAERFIALQSIYARGDHPVRIITDFNGELAPGGTTRIETRIEEPGVYVFAGVCDAECRNLNLRLYSHDGALIEQDVARDENPIVHIEVLTPGSISIDVEMARCETSSCYYGVAIYRG